MMCDEWTINVTLAALERAWEKCEQERPGKAVSTFNIASMMLICIYGVFHIKTPI
jgi:hypothetical protein